MSGLFGSTMFLLSLLLWQFHWCIPEWWLFITLVRRCELCRKKLCITYFNMISTILWPSFNWQDEDESLVPPVIPLSSEHVSDEGIYLLENGEDCLIYIGNLVDSNILQQLFNISPSDEIPTQVVFVISFRNM